MNIGQVVDALVNVHPWHTLAVHFPIALTAVALLFVAVALWRGSEWFEHAAYYTIALVTISTVVAALTGVRDNIVRFEGGAPLIPAKVFLAASLFALVTAVSVSRLRRPDVLWQPGTVVLYVAGFVGSFGLAAVLGFLGGVILYGI